VVVGDGSALGVLRRADAAKAVLALGDDDSANAFVVMAAREFAVVLHARPAPGAWQRRVRAFGYMRIERTDRSAPS